MIAAADINISKIEKSKLNDASGRSLLDVYKN